MKRYLLPLVALLALALVGLALVAIGGERLDRGQVYTVAQVRERLAAQPTAWVGRTVLVHAIAVTCVPNVGGPAGGPYMCIPPSLIDPGPSDPPVWLPLTPQAPTPLLTVLRRLPLVGTLVPAPQAVRWLAVTTYRVQLRAVPAGSCPSLPCYEALLPDAAPSAQ